MVETAAYLVNRVIRRVPFRQWVLSFPIPLRILFAAHPQLLTPLLRIVHQVITRFLLKQARLKRATANTGAVTLNQQFGSAANLNIHLHCLVLDGVYRHTAGEPVFQEAQPPTRAELQSLLDKVIARLMKMLTRQGYLVEEQRMTYLTDIGPDHPLKALQAASCTYRITFGPRAGHKVLSLHTVASRNEQNTAVLCAEVYGFSLYAAARVVYISATRSNGCAAISPAPRSATNVVTDARYVRSGSRLCENVRSLKICLWRLSVMDSTASLSTSEIFLERKNAVRRAVS